MLIGLAISLRSALLIPADAPQCGGVSDHCGDHPRLDTHPGLRDGLASYGGTSGGVHPTKGTRGEPEQFLEAQIFNCVLLKNYALTRASR